MSSTKVKQTELPPESLLNRYKESKDFTDCYRIDLEQKIDFKDYVYAFYTSWLFKLERFVLKWLVNKPSTDEGVQLLALGEVKKFAAWSVEARAENQLLLCDYQGQTRSWLRVIEQDDGVTSIYFGSAVVYKRDNKGRTIEFNQVFKFISLFHHIYSKALLSCAAKKLLKLRNKI